MVEVLTGMSAQVILFYAHKIKKILLLCFFFGDADPLYINKLDTINSLLHPKKHVRGSSNIRFVALSLHNERTKLRVSAVDPK